MPNQPTNVANFPGSVPPQPGPVPPQPQPERPPSPQQIGMAILFEIQELLKRNDINAEIQTKAVYTLAQAYTTLNPPQEAAGIPPEQQLALQKQKQDAELQMQAQKHQQELVHAAQKHELELAAAQQKQQQDAQLHQFNIQKEADSHDFNKKLSTAKLQIAAKKSSEDNAKKSQQGPTA